MTVMDGIPIIKDFIGIGKDLAGLPKLLLPQYKTAATDLYKICQKILVANENTARWYFGFIYFNFRDPNAAANFMDMARNYQVMKAGPEAHQLKFNCGDIERIYQEQIKEKLGDLVADPQKQTEARNIFQQLSVADGMMVDYLQDVILQSLDRVVTTVEPFAKQGDLVGADRAMLEIRDQTQGIAEYLVTAGNGLSDLTLKFSKIAGVPLTLS